MTIEYRLQKVRPHLYCQLRKLNKNVDGNTPLNEVGFDPYMNGNMSIGWVYSRTLKWRKTGLTRAQVKSDRRMLELFFNPEKYTVQDLENAICDRLDRQVDDLIAKARACAHDATPYTFLKCTRLLMNSDCVMKVSMFEECFRNLNFRLLMPELVRHLQLGYEYLIWIVNGLTKACDYYRTKGERI